MMMKRPQTRQKPLHQVMTPNWSMARSDGTESAAYNRDLNLWHQALCQA